MILREGVRDPYTKEVGTPLNESPLTSMFQKQQTVNDLKKERGSYLSILEKGKQLGFSRVLYEETHTT
jgi:hypothetical protein